MRPIKEFTVRVQGSRNRNHILKDNVTGVEYIVIAYNESICITPRLHSDGSLYCGPEEQLLSDDERYTQYLSRKQRLENSKLPKRQGAAE